jgi:thiol-disulfide isomerase/thioredoxin
MKKIIVNIFCLILMQLSVFAQKYTIISGSIPSYAERSISIQYFATPFQNSLDQTEIALNAKGFFKTRLPILEHQIINLFLGSEIIRFHTAPGDSLYIVAVKTDGKTTHKISGKGAIDANWFQKQKSRFEATIENEKFSNLMLTEMGNRSANEFKSLLDSISLVKTNYLNQNKKELTESFYNWQTAEIKYELECFKINYPSWFYTMRGIENKIKEVDSTYFIYLDQYNKNDETFLNSTQYRNWLKYYFMYVIRTKNIQYNSIDLYSFCGTLFTGKTLNTFRLHLWSDIMQYGQMSDATTLYPMVKKQLGTLDGFGQLEQKYKEKMPFVNGTPAIPFSLKSIDGKNVSLADFKGKVVYIDFWASWCGPCKREIPAGEQLKKYFEGKEVVFLNISIDEDENKWRDAVKNYQISGIHLLANSKNNPTVLEAYKVASIPSYFLIDKQGNFIAAPAPRPSSDGTQQLIESGLK